MFLRVFDYFIMVLTCYFVAGWFWVWACGYGLCLLFGFRFACYIGAWGLFAMMGCLLVLVCSWFVGCRLGGLLGLRCFMVWLLFPGGLYVGICFLLCGVSFVGDWCCR